MLCPSSSTLKIITNDLKKFRMDIVHTCTCACYGFTELSVHLIDSAWHKTPLCGSRLLSPCCWAWIEPIWKIRDTGNTTEEKCHLICAQVYVCWCHIMSGQNVRAITSPGRQKMLCSLISCSIRSTVVVSDGKCCRSIPTIMYMAPAGITGFNPGTVDSSP